MSVWLDIDLLQVQPFIKIRKKPQGNEIFDTVRKKWLILQPEEWVRQHFIRFLLKEKSFPSALLQIEGGLSLNQTKKRSDILVYAQSGEKLMVIECKAPSVNITQATFDQAARYNSVYKAKWLVITNGLNHYYAQIDHHNKAFKLVEDLPVYSHL